LRFILTMSSADTVKQKVEYAIPILAAWYFFDSSIEIKDSFLGKDAPFYKRR
jgi:hypothetical protein